MCKMCASDESVIAAPPPEPTPRISKSLERLKNKHNIVTDPNNEEKQKEVAYQPDLLAVSTQYTKVAYDLFRTVVESVQDSKAYAVATKTSQPFHVAFGAIVLLTWLTKSGSDASLRGWKAVYVGSLATHFGAQVWMTLISGLVLYFNLPRHEFGRVQTVLFPVYYAFNAAMSLLALSAYFKIQCLTRFAHTSFVQFALLAAVAAIELYVRLRLVRPMLRAKHTKTQMEEVAGGGQEVGRLILGELAHCPRYIRVLKTFRMYHSSIAMGTMIALGCSLYSIMILVDSMCH